jgi:uncharacterized protein
MRIILKSLLGTLALSLLTAAFAPVSAQTTGRPATENEVNQLRTRLNENAVSIVSGTPAGTYLAIAYDMAATLDSGFDMRVLPIAGKGSVQNVRDILHLKGVDMGIVQSDVLAFFRQSGELGAGVEKRLVYIAKLYNEEMHLVAGPGINSIQDLAGKKVNFAEVNSGTQYSSRLIFDALKINVQEVNMGQTDAIVKIRAGEIAATVFIAGRPANAVAQLPKDAGLKLLQVPFTTELENIDYFPASFAATDYPNLIQDGKKIDTIAVGAVLASYNWPAGTDKHRRLTRFCDALVTKFPEFLKAPRHPKWKEVNLAANLKAWNRFEPMQARLQQAGIAAPKR